MELINVEDLCDIFEASTIIDEARHGSFQIHTIRHPELGEVKTVQCCRDKALLFEVHN